MSNTYTLTPETYVYSFVNINSTDADGENPPTALAVGKNVAMFPSDSPAILKSGDKLIVHGTEIVESQWKGLSNSFYFTGQTLMYESGWKGGRGYCFIGVNSEGDSILALPKTRGPPNEITTFRLPLKFDWCCYGVRVPNSVLDEKEVEIENLKKQAADFTQQLEEKDTEVEKKVEEIKEMEQNISELKQNLEGKDKMMEDMKGKITKLSEKKDEVNAFQSEFQFLNQKLDQLLSTLQIYSNVGRNFQLSEKPAVPIVESRRCNFPSEKFLLSSSEQQPLSMRPVVRIGIQNLRVFTAVDENVEGQVPKGNIDVCVSDGRFSKNEWWFIKAVEIKTTTMLGFYDGDFDQVSVQGNYVSVPFRPEACLSSNTEFFVGLIRGVGLRFMFLY